MSQRSLFVVLFVVLFAACEEDTIVSLNAVNFTKSHLSNIAESARRAAEQTDVLAARLAAFTDSAAGLADSAIAFADSARVAAVLLAAADHDLRVAASAASSFFLFEKDEAKVIEKVYDAYDARRTRLASEAYEVARRTSFAAYVAAAAAYDARRARLASKAYEIARRTAAQTAATARRAAAQAAAAQAAAAQAAAQAAARRAAAVADSLQAASEVAQAGAQTATDKAVRLRRAYNKDAAAQAAARRAAAVADSLQAASEVAETATAARRAAAKAAEAAKVYAVEAARLRRAYNKDAVQAAYEVAAAAAYATSYEAYQAGACRAASYANIQAKFGTAFADTSSLVIFGCGTYSGQAAIQAARTAYATYVDSAAYAAAYNAAHALFNAAYAPDSSDPQAAAAEAYVTAAAEAARRGKNKAVLDSAYVTLPISTATAALATSKAAYLACATYIDSLLNSIE